MPQYGNGLYMSRLPCNPSDYAKLPGRDASRPYAAQMDVPVQVVAVAGVAAIIGAVAGCSGNASKSPAPSSKSAAPSSSASALATTTTPAAAPGPALTGLGATVAQWNAAHTLDVSVPAGNAYLPRVDGNEDTWQLVTVAGGRISSYTLNVPPSSLRSAEAQARQEMPADTQVLWTRTVPGTCAQVQFESATLAAALGEGQVNVEFDNASSGSDTPVTEELFGGYDAPTVAQAPAC
jgi:hypothetical protein